MIDNMYTRLRPIPTGMRLTVVPIASATAPNSVALLAFPAIGTALHMTQTQFGLWSALAIHDTSSVVGATAKFSRNTVPRETAISSSLAFVIGAIAAMALPPQIAVPAVMRNEGSFLHIQQSSQPPTQNHGEADAACGVETTQAANAKNLLQIHAESKAHHGCL